MKKTILIFILTIFLLLSFTLNTLGIEKPETSGNNVILADYESGKILYKKNIEDKIAPGGFTKIMTAIVAIESMMQANETVVVEAGYIDSYDYSFGHMGILAGEIMTLEDLLNGMLIYDAGDAAEVIASYTFDSREKFISTMNSKAVEIGALNTKFTNPTGFPDEKQYSTLEDIYKITRYAMEMDYFKEIVSKHRYEMNPTNKYHQKRYLDNKNKYLSATSTDKYYTIRAKGVKSSYIDDDNCGVILHYETDKISLMTLVSGARFDGTTNYAYEDTEALLDYGLNYYSSVKAVSEGDILAEIELLNGSGTDRILLEAMEDIYVNLPKDYDEDLLKTAVVLEENIKAPISKGKVLGSVTVLYDGEEYVASALTSPVEVKANNIKGLLLSVWRFLTAPVVLVIFGLILIVMVWCTLIFNKNKTYKIDRK